MYREITNEQKIMATKFATQQRVAFVVVPVNTEISFFSPIDILTLDGVGISNSISFFSLTGTVTSAGMLLKYLFGTLTPYLRCHCPVVCHYPPVPQNHGPSTNENLEGPPYHVIRRHCQKQHCCLWGSSRL